MHPSTPMNRDCGIRNALLGTLICLCMIAWGLPVCAASNADCLSCHSAPTIHKTQGLKTVPLYVDTQGFGASVHAKMNCTDCHADLKSEPLKHKTKVAPVDCAKCHEKKGWNPNTIHYAVPTTKTPPACKDCHGNHYIKPKTDPASRTYKTRADATCAVCHAGQNAVKVYEHGLHSVMTTKGQPAARCTDCHSPHSGVLATSPVVCSMCHDREYKQYEHSSHGKAQLEGNADVPSCVTCHGAHDMLPKSDPLSKTHFTNEPALCSGCHDDAEKMRSYDLPTNTLATYRHSYHGVANKYGDKKAAVCSSCHEAHNILPSSDMASSASKANLPRTCGKCHKGLLKKVAQGQSHVVISSQKKDVLFWVSFAFKWLTIGTMLALIGHILLDLQTRIRKRLWKDHE